MHEKHRLPRDMLTIRRDSPEWSRLRHVTGRRSGIKRHSRREGAGSWLTQISPPDRQGPLRSSKKCDRIFQKTLLVTTLCGFQGRGDSGASPPAGGLTCRGPSRALTHLPTETRTREGEEIPQGMRPCRDGAQGRNAEPQGTKRPF